MKILPLSIAPLVAIAALGVSTHSAQADVIDISKPLDQSINPTGIYWKFDEGQAGASAPSATDHSGNGFDGTFKASATGGLPTYAGGKFGNGVNIQRTSGTTPNDLDPSIYWGNTAVGGEAPQLDFAASSGFTAGLWLKMDDYDKGKNQTIYLLERGLSTFPSPTGTQRNFFSFQLNKWTGDNWTLNLLLGDGINSTVAIGPGSGISFTALNDLDWHHLAFSLETTDDGSLVSFYLDGELLGAQSVSYTLAPFFPTDGAARQVSIGERIASSHGSAFNGTMDDVFITQGIHTFAIPEPSVAILLPLVGAGLVIARKSLK